MNEINSIKLEMMKIETNLKNFGDKLDGHITLQKETDKKVEDNFSKIFNKIDRLSDTFQTRIGDRASEAEVRARFNDIDGLYVSKEAFGPVQKIVYGLAGGMLIAFLGAIVTLLFQ